MRIVVWNCAQRLRGEKLNALESLRPDIAIVPECESPHKLWGKQPLLAPIPMEWIGDNENKGLGVLAFNGYRIKRHPAYDPSLRWMLPVEVRGPLNFHLLAVWAANHRILQTEDEDLPSRPLEVVEHYLGTFDAWVGRGLSDHVPLIVDVPVHPDGKSAKPDKAIRTDLEC